MTEQFLNMMRQWLEQLDQQSSTDGQTHWEQLQQALTAGLSDTIPAEHTDLLLKLTRQSASFNRFATRLLEQDPQGDIDLTSLLEQFKQHLDQLSSEWVLHSWHLPEQLGILMTLFTAQQAPLQDNLNQFTQLVTTLLSKLQPTARPDLAAQIKECLSLLERFEHARTRYMAQLSTINSLALELMSQELEAQPLTDLDHLHHLWIESYEQIYQQRIGTSEYCEALGEISNAAMALRHGWQLQCDRLCSALGLTTDTRHDELAQRHHQLRRRVRALERELADLRQTLESQATDKDHHV